MILQNQREEYSVLDKKGMYLIKYKKNPRLSAPKLRGIVENTTRKTMYYQTICLMMHKYDFHSRKVQQQKKDVW